MTRRTPLRRLLPPALAVVGFAWLVSAQWLWARVLATLYPGESPVLFPAGTLAQLTVRHLQLVGISSAITIAVGLPLGIWATRRSGRAFREIIVAAADVGQTFPPVAVLALSMPLLGLGALPTIVALFLYGLFPVVSGTIAGIEGVPRPIVDAAGGMGMDAGQLLRRVELPLASRVILAGIRISVIVNVGTATVGAAFGAGGLGGPIVGGLLVQNMAFITEGAVTAALLAILLDALLAALEGSVVPVAT